MSVECDSVSSVERIHHRSHEIYLMIILCNLVSVTKTNHIDQYYVLEVDVSSLNSLPRKYGTILFSYDAWLFIALRRMISAVWRFLWFRFPSHLHLSVSCVNFASICNRFWTACPFSRRSHRYFACYVSAFMNSYWTSSFRRRRSYRHDRLDFDCDSTHVNTTVSSDSIVTIILNHTFPVPFSYLTDNVLSRFCDEVIANDVWLVTICRD